MRSHAEFAQAQPVPAAVKLAQFQARLGAKLRLGLHSRTLRYGLRRDLGVGLERPSAKIPIAVRPMVETDLATLLAVTGETSPEDRLEIAWRRAFVDKGATGCYVAVDQRDGTPCYMQWLMGADQNAFIKRLGGFPELRPDEALLENAYTPATHRGLGVMAAAMALIAERAADLNARYVLTFVERSNIASLKGCQRAGFFPHMAHHRVQWALGMIKQDSFEVFAPDDERRQLRF